ncbi:hypothetical protein [Cellulophaga sp. E6(2014)]|uniref:hypothetical protein n=1 Tax=Cellulophaga sp. E6(2014) TaxID=1495334 RepID=UPI001269980C|nr:hypothetical protein [Cellulophaga sp. E6(2014)]
MTISFEAMIATGVANGQLCSLEGIAMGFVNAVTHVTICACGCIIFNTFKVGIHRCGGMPHRCYTMRYLL